MDALRYMYRNFVPAGKNERGEWYWTNERNEISRDCDWPAVLKWGEYKMWYQNGILDHIGSEFILKMAFHTVMIWRQ